ncbi:MAG: phosphate-starvation-inducible PsiE family protein [Lachnospiraceae bacterium]|nr:phosphate-starvation-inducible PsiE family protein [Lachnospiraceae bacterium]
MKKFTTIMGKLGDILEIILSIFVALAAVAAVISFVPEFFGMMTDGLGLRELSEVLEEILTVVIAVEFLKMLLKPTSLTVIEVLIFLIARHMILQQTTPTQDLISVIGICLLLAAKLVISHYKTHQNLPGIDRMQNSKVNPGREDGQSQGTDSSREVGQNQGTDSSREAGRTQGTDSSREANQTPEAGNVYTTSPYQVNSTDHADQEQKGAQNPAKQRIYHDLVREADSIQDKNADE